MQDRLSLKIHISDFQRNVFIYAHEDPFSPDVMSGNYKADSYMWGKTDVSRHHANVIN